MVGQTQRHVQRGLLRIQRANLLAHFLYDHLAGKARNPLHARIFSELSESEFKNYRLFVAHSGIESKRPSLLLRAFAILRVLFGLTFVVKLVERGERRAELAYQTDPLREHYAKDIDQMQRDCGVHEQTLIALIDEKRLNYLGSVVLGLNDALVELTGALAGLTFAFQDTRLIALTGLITGIAASFSMGSSEYLSQKTEELEGALTSAVYTFLSYLVTVAVLITPFLLLTNPYAALAITLTLALAVIALFSFYISIVKEYSFSRRFGGMATVSLGVAGLSFVVGVAVKLVLGVDV